MQQYRLRTSLYRSTTRLLRDFDPSLSVHERAQCARTAMVLGLVAETADGRAVWLSQNYINDNGISILK